jgi:hypothetical protein
VCSESVLSHVRSKCSVLACLCVAYEGERHCSAILTVCLNTGPVIIASSISAWICSRKKCQAGRCKVDEVTEGYGIYIMTGYIIFTVHKV